MPRLLLTTLILSLLSAVFSASSAAQDHPLAFTHVTVIDTTGTPALPDMTVIVAGKKITQLGKSASTPVPKSATTVDATGKFLIPGLWDMHVHEIFGEWIPHRKK